MNAIAMIQRCQARQEAGYEADQGQFVNLENCGTRGDETIPAGFRSDSLPAESTAVEGWRPIVSDDTGV